MAVKIRRFVVRHLYRRRPVKILAYLTSAFIGSLLLLIIFGGDSFEPIADVEEAEFKNLRKLAQDLDLNTSDYLVRFQEYSITKTLHKAFYDAKYVQAKHIINDEQRIRAGQLRKKNYIILEYTKVFDRTKFCQFFTNAKSFKEGANQLYIRECPYKNCRFTCDKSEYPDADALLFHETDVKNEHRKNDGYIPGISMLHRRNPQKIFILWNDEANPVDPLINEIGFNWTMSYRYDAEITDCAYGCTYNRKSPANKRKMFLKQLEWEFKRRKSRALWFVSNCQSKYRIDFTIGMMDESLPIQIIGVCQRVVRLKQTILSFLNLDSWLGTIVFGLIKGLTELLHVTENCPRNSDCELRHLSGSMFYLSYESKNCTNYITEKFWRTLRFNIIPVVIQPQKKFYEQIAPPNSFIHAEDFNYDPILLANYLKKVASDFSLYSKYLLWKAQHETVFSAQQTESRRLCEMCTQLNEQQSTIYYEDMASWFNYECIVN